MTKNRIQRAVDRPLEVELWCRDYHGTVVKNQDGIPIAFRERCKNRECCPQKRGMMFLHVWDLVTGEFETLEIASPNGAE